MIIERLSRPNALAFDLSEAKSHAHVTDDFEDFDFARMIEAATREAEEYAQIALLSQYIRVVLPCWPRALTISLPITPLLDWSTVTVTANGVGFDDFSVITGQRPALRLSAGRPAGEVIIDYQAGYGDQAGDIPADLRHALLDQIATYYDARGAVDRSTITLSPHFARIVGRLRGVRA